MIKLKQFLSGASESGQAMVEFALILPIMILLIFGGVDVVMTSTESARVEDFYADIHEEMSVYCPTATELFAQPGTFSAGGWANNDAEWNPWIDSTIKTLADRSGLDEYKFVFLIPNGDGTFSDAPDEEVNAQQFWIDFDGSEYNIAFKYKIETVTGFVFPGAFDSEYVKTAIQCK